MTSGECIQDQEQGAEEDQEPEAEEINKLAIALGITLPVLTIAAISIFIYVKKPFAFQKVSTEQNTANISEEK